MYQSHWSLRESPFRASLDLGYFHNSPVHEEALARLHFLVADRRRVGLLLGPRGSGKSLLLQVFASELRSAGHAVAPVSLLGLGQGSLLRELATGLGLYPEGPESIGCLWQSLVDRISEFRYQQLPTVVLLDDADQGGPEAITLVTRLAQHDLRPDSRLTLVLAGRQVGVGRLGRTLLELAELRMDLAPWEPADTEAYLTASLSRAGCARSVFEPSAVARLHELGQGIPRRIRHLADLSLLAGAGRDLARIDAQTVESVFDELGVVRAGT